MEREDGTEGKRIAENDTEDPEKRFQSARGLDYMRRAFSSGRKPGEVKKKLTPGKTAHGCNQDLESPRSIC